MNIFRSIGMPESWILDPGSPPEVPSLHNHAIAWRIEPLMVAFIYVFLALCAFVCVAGVCVCVSVWEACKQHFAIAFQQYGKFPLLSNATAVDIVVPAVFVAWEQLFLVYCLDL